ncbi:MAG: hypothetical protein LBM74_09555 [Oscillospiraceae bacterium]|jgi:Holliday junction resolvase-like predicted endonuclease|nr:hypothetical protein [Oscillospiraceae bacterium]
MTNISDKCVLCEYFCQAHVAEAGKYSRASKGCMLGKRRRAKCEKWPADIACCYQWLAKQDPNSDESAKKYAQELLNRWAELDEIKHIERKEGYKRSSHDGKPTSPNTGDEKCEKEVAKDLFRLCNGEQERLFLPLGKFIDYETPLGTSRNNTYGDIDLLAYNEETSTYTIVELKRKDNKESLLRAVVEAFTYSKRVWFDKLVEDFGLSAKGPIQKAVLVFKGEKQHDQYKNQPTVRALMEKLGVELFVISKAGKDDYRIEGAE